jgi:hypothetical protein
MGVLAGPYVAAATLLLVSGALKVRRPAATSGVLARRGPRRLVPILGLAEVLVGLGALTVDGPVFPLLAAGLYLGFSAFVALALASDEQVSDCGCFGAAEAPPTVLHLLLNIGAAATCGAVGLGSGGTLGRAVEAQPLLGVPFLLLTGTCVALVYSVLTVLPRSRAVART